VSYIDLSHCQLETHNCPECEAEKDLFLSILASTTSAVSIISDDFDYRLLRHYDKAGNRVQHFYAVNLDCGKNILFRWRDSVKSHFILDC
jgi:hypothetical protein